MVNNYKLTRRRVFLLGLGSLAGIVALAGGRVKYQSSRIQSGGNLQRSFKTSGELSLKQRAAAKGLIYGAAAYYNILSSNPKFANFFAQQSAILVPELELKWSSGKKHLRPNRQSFDFKAADWMVNFAQKHSLLFRGHTLVWHESLPRWFKEQVNRQNAETVLTEHIKTVVGRYAGKIHSWDVVNEAIAPHEQRKDGLRKSRWLDLLGTDYIELAFRLTNQADPNTLLVYNEFGLEYDVPKDEAKRDAVLNLLQSLKSKGVPVHALGIQAHLSGSKNHLFNPSKYREFLKNVASLGLKIMITELDVTDQTLTKSPIIRDRIIASAYEDYLSAALDEPAVIAAINWGLSDPHSWLGEFKARQDKAPVRPLPFDDQLQPKLAWNAIARAFDRAPKR